MEGFFFPDSTSFGMKFNVRFFLIQQSSHLPVPLDFCTVAVHTIHLEVIFAVSFDERSRYKSHDGDGQELSQRSPGEDVIQRGDLWENGARPNTDEVVGDQTWKQRAASGWQMCASLFLFVRSVCVCVLTYQHGEEENGYRDVEDRTGDVEEPVRSHGEETKEKEEKEQAATIVLHLTEDRKKKGKK